MRWFVSRFVNQTSKWQPRVCNILFHLPYSLEEPCDCQHVCKWPPRGGTGPPIILQKDLEEQRAVPDISSSAT